MSARRGGGADLAIAGLVIAVVAMMIVPLPRPLLDVLLAANLGLTVVILMAAVLVRSPRRLAAFPTILVVTTLLRVGLNVSTTRLILGSADGGRVVHAFGSAVVAGNLVVGLVVFAVITIVQLLVVARGAERVAEVAARFALDAMPGRQLGIDADVRAGVLDDAGARAARAALTHESQLYGAMDGAMRFVKGDAIAAILIVVINLIGGLVIGIGYRGLSAGDAVHAYSLLSIGEGLVAQIPSLILAVASGLLVTRVASASDGAIGDEVGAALWSQPRALGGAAVLMAVLAAVPGLPLAPFAALAVGFAAGALWLARRPAVDDADEQVAAAGLTVALGRDLGAAPPLEALRAQVERELGVSCPPLTLAAGVTGLAPRELRLALDGVALTWLTVAAAEPVAAALERALRQVAHELVGIEDTAARVTRTARTHPVLVREVVPRLIALPALAELSRDLVREQVPVRDFAAVLEAIATAPPTKEPDPARLTEHVRAQLRRQISSRWAPHGQLEVYTLDGMIEDAVRSALDRRDGVAVLALEPDLARDIVGAVRTQVGAAPAVVLTSGDLRRPLRALLEGELPDVAVLAPHELAPGVAVRAAGRIEV